ncbi:MAG: MBL fold metallo-hydrolase, partial [Clostridia bacterium]|nr:MBL fold metallo-hydrolase [Clostridia bacterium]
EENETTRQQIPLPQVPENSYLEVHFLDVGQADSALIVCDGQTMLIDGGNRGAEDIVNPYLAERNIKHLNYVVATHPHADHYGGLTEILHEVTADTIFSPFKKTDIPAFNRFVNYVHYTMRNQITVPTVGQQFYLGSARVTVLGPLRLDYEDINDTSLVLKIEYGELAFLFTGDMEGAAEIELVNTGVDLSADVIKVGHHGSYSSSWYQFLRAVAPKYGVISCGRDNEYGHPHESVLSRYRDADVKLYRTDLQGHIVCRSEDGKTLTFTTQMNPDAITNPTAVKNDISYLPTYLYYEEKFD